MANTDSISTGASFFGRMASSSRCAAAAASARAVVSEAVRVDGGDMLLNERVLEASAELGVPATLLWATRGLQGQTPGLYDEVRLADLGLERAHETDELGVVDVPLAAQDVVERLDLLPHEPVDPVELGLEVGVVLEAPHGRRPLLSRTSDRSADCARLHDGRHTRQGILMIV